MMENVKISDGWGGNAQRRIYVSLVSTWSKGQSSLNCFLDIYQCSKPKTKDSLQDIPFAAHTI